MRVPALLLTLLIFAAGTFGASAQMTKPFEVLEGARRDRIERDARMRREAADQRRTEQETQRKRDAAADASRLAPAASTPADTAPAKPGARR